LWRKNAKKERKTFKKEGSINCVRGRPGKNPRGISGEGRTGGRRYAHEKKGQSGGDCITLHLSPGGNRKRTSIRESPRKILQNERGSLMLGDPPEKVSEGEGGGQENLCGEEG